MMGWQWFWTLVGFLLLILVLIFLYFFQPFEDLFTTILHGVNYSNAIFWVGIVGFCAFHWNAYRVHIVQQRSVESMVLTSLRGSAFTAILLSGGGTLQAVQNVCVYILQGGYGFDAGFGKRIAAIIALVLITALFCVIFWLLKLIRPARA